MTVIAKGLEGIVANSTAISDVRGEEGVLIYAGYNINELAGKASYEEVVYLLWHGELPNAAQLATLKQELASLRELPQGVVDFLKSAPKDANPMDVIARRSPCWVSPIRCRAAISNPSPTAAGPLRSPRRSA